MRPLPVEIQENEPRAWLSNYLDATVYWTMPSKAMVLKQWKPNLGTHFRLMEL